MFAGLVPYARRDEVEAFYREVSTDWYFLRPRDVSGVQTFTCEHWPDANNACVDIPVNELAQVQMEIPEKAEWRCKPPPTLPLEQLAARGIATGWNWRTLQTEFPSLHQQGAGLAFEDFLSALVKAAGATNTVKSLELWEGGKPRHEFDVIVSNGQKIVIFDLKLTSEVDDPIIDQFSRLAEDRRSLGGLGADAIAVRPTWSENPIATALANAHHVALWTQNEMGNLVERITDVLRLPRLSPNNPAFGVSKQLRQAASEQKRLFSSSFSARNPMSDSPVEVSIGWLSLDKYFLECFTLAKRMVVLDMNGRFVIRGLCPESGWRTQADLASFLGDLGKVELFKVALSGGSFFAVVVPLSGNVASVREKLKQMQSPRAHL